MEVRTWRSARSQVFLAASELAGAALDGSLSAALLSDAPSDAASAAVSEAASEVSGAAEDEVCSGVGAALGLDGAELYAALILAALPTAQNVYNYAATYEVGETVARDTVFLTTFLSLPAMLQSVLRLR